jgi:hypothetical protein
MHLSLQPFDSLPLLRHDPLRARVQAEFAEMPGLVLSLDQAAKLFGIDAVSCEEVLSELVADGFLRMSGRRFRRAS